MDHLPCWPEATPFTAVHRCNVRAEDFAVGAITSVAADLEDSGAAATRVNFFNNKFYSVGLARVELVHP